ncbi:GWxTD domain-containing protein [Cyclonatronum proteinivorum]|uniref:GWxTD domain-containing protein n=1 Tax=Cyclonatronum proteinivorum TaxID=1457365 RepID=A0A345ULW9_9BACT|nr:GWxTD domain-containing protein [Cyclonatronum proteinivorum]AXJ01471.1 GWxTD domain-containing protein [Cyclonatronum proteinivorum]
MNLIQRPFQSVHSLPLKHVSGLFILTLVCVLTAAEAFAQRNVSYRELAAQNRAPGLYIDHNVIKAEAGEPNVWLHYRFGHDVLRFRQIAGTTGNVSTERFEATAELSVQIFEASEPGQNGEARRGSAIKTLTWRGQTRAADFDETSRRDLFLNANLSAALPPGRYAYSTSLTLDGRPLQLRQSTRFFTVPDFESSDAPPLYFVNPADLGSDQFEIINFGRAVLYAQDFDALLVVPGTDSTYRVIVNQVEPGGRDTTTVRRVHESDVAADQIRSIQSMRISESAQALPLLGLTEAEADADGAFHLLQLNIPNRKFQNASFVIQVKKGDELLTERFFRNLWLDIPTSLLNIDVAIRKMEIILDRDTHRELRRGNEQQRIKNFRAFWEARDPEPETDYNPVMVEFFRRVDMAFDRFTTPNQPGYDSDQGRTLIRFGEPERITRRLPTGSAAIEVWQYSDREFVFEATSGFGEYRLLRTNRL